MDFIDDKCVLRQNVAVLKPAARDACRDNDHVELRQFGRGFAFAVDDADAQRRAQNFFGNRANRQRFAGAGSRDNAKTLAAARQIAHTFALCLFEVSIEVKTNADFNGFARGARRRNDNHATGGWLTRDKSVMIEWECAVFNRTNHVWILAQCRRRENGVIGKLSCSCVIIQQ